MFCFFILQWVLVLGWVLSAVSLALGAYSLYFFDFGPAASAVYTSLSHTAWAMALAWIVFVCTTGNASKYEFLGLVLYLTFYLKGNEL